MAKIVWETVLWLWAMYAFITSHIVFFLDQVKPHPHVQCVIIWKKKKKKLLFVWASWCYDLWFNKSIKTCKIASPFSCEAVEFEYWTLYKERGSRLWPDFSLMSVLWYINGFY